MPTSPVSGWRRFLPGPSLISMRERIYAVMGALLGLLCCEWISQQMLIGLNPWFIGPMGASAVLLFAAPTTPMALLWPMLGGNLVSGVKNSGDQWCHRRYPHKPLVRSNQHRTRDLLPSKRLGIRQSDLDAVLAARGEVLDISKSDLEAI